MNQKYETDDFESDDWQDWIKEAIERAYRSQELINFREPSIIRCLAVERNGEPIGDWCITIERINPPSRSMIH